jgi:hypothetical protein
LRSITPLIPQKKKDNVRRPFYFYVSDVEQWYRKPKENAHPAKNKIGVFYERIILF